MGRAHRSLVHAFVGLALGACGSPAVFSDGGSLDGARPSACGALEVVELAPGAQRIEGVLAGVNDVVDVATACGDAGPRAAQLYELHAPPDRAIAATYTLANELTASTLGIVTEVRSRCDDRVNAVCGVAATPIDARPRGALAIEAGGTAYLLVAGRDATSLGRYAVDLDVRERSQPSLSSARAFRASGGDWLRVEASGMDAAGDVVALGLRFLGSDGPVAGTLGVEQSFGPTDTRGSVDFLAHRSLGPLDPLDEVRTATRVEVRAIDEAGDRSAVLTVSIEDESDAHVGEACDEVRGPLCAQGLACVTGACELTAEAQAVCDAATVVPLAEGTPFVELGHLFGRRGYVFPACASALGREVAYRITTPASGRYDLLASTDSPDTGDTDTVLYLQTRCGDASSEVAGACNDDAGGTLRSTIEFFEVPSATEYFLFVDAARAELDGPYAISIALRPVRAVGEPCDATVRCAEGVCAGGICN